MTNVINRNSVLAIKKEVTEGLAVDPSASSDYVPLSDGFALSPTFETLESSELASSIGQQKSLIGGETPTASFDHYIRASGTVGVAPDIDVLLESLLGNKEAVAVERDVVAGSTVSVLNVDAGEGVEFRRGRAVLIQDAGNSSYQIRNVLSVATDALTLAQNLSFAPASGVLVGRPIIYYPAQVNHPTFTSHLYRGNDGLYEAIAGCRTLSMEVTIDAEQFITSSYSIEGIKYFFNPVRTLATDIYLDFSDSVPTLYAAQVQIKKWTTPHELASALQTAMNAQGSADVFSVVYNDRGSNAGRFTISSDGTVFELLWNTGANTANTIGDVLGFSIVADDTGALTYTSDTEQDWSSPYAPVYDTTNPNVAKNIECILGDAGDISCFGVSSLSVTIENTKSNVQDICEESGKSGSIINGRTATASITARVAKHDVKFFEKFRNGDSSAFTVNFGVKSGGNWLKGSCVNIHMPTTTISEFTIEDLDGLAIIQMSVSAFVQDGLDEIFVNMI